MPLRGTPTNYAERQAELRRYKLLNDPDGAPSLFDDAEGIIDLIRLMRSRDSGTQSGLPFRDGRGNHRQDEQILVLQTWVSL